MSAETANSYKTLVPATRNKPLDSCLVADLSAVCTSDGWAEPVGEMPEEYEAKLKTFYFLGHYWWWRNCEKSLRWACENWLCNRIRHMCHTHPKQKPHELVEQIIQADSNWMGKVLAAINGVLPSEQVDEARHASTTCLAFEREVGIHLYTRYLQRQATLETITPRPAPYETTATQQPTMQVNNYIYGENPTVQNIETQINTTAAEQQTTQMPRAFDKAKGYQLWEFLAQKELVEVNYTPLPAAMFVLGCSSIPPKKHVRIQWLDSKQALYELIMAAYAPVIGKNGFTKKYISETLTPACFEDKQHRPIKLNNDKPDPASWASAVIKEFFATEW